MIGGGPFGVMRAVCPTRVLCTVSSPDSCNGTAGASLPETGRHGDDVRTQIGGLGRSVLLTYLSVLTTTLCGLFVVGFALRTIGPGGYGTFALISILALVVGVLDFGLGLGVIRATAVHRNDGDEAAAALALQDIVSSQRLYALLGITIVGICVTTAIALSVAGLSGQVVVTLVLVGCSMAVNLGFAVYQGVVQGLREYGVLAAATISGTLASTAVAVALLPRVGIVGLGAAQLVTALVTRAWLAAWIRRNAAWSRAPWKMPTRAEARRIADFAGPLVFVSGASQLINASNLWFIGAVGSPATAGIFRAASALPTQATQVLFRGYDVLFPTLVAVGGSQAQERLNAHLTRAVSLVAGFGFGVMALRCESIAGLLVGSTSPDAAKVIALFAIVWMVNVPVHGLYLLVIARQEQRRFVALTLAEGVANVVLTIGLTPAFGAPGAAAANLLVIVVSNAAVFPALFSRVMRAPAFRYVYVDGLGRVGCGALCAFIADRAVGTSLGSLSLWAVCLTGFMLLLPMGWVSLGRQARETLRAVAAAKNAGSS